MTTSLKKILQKELDEILTLHEKYLLKEADGKQAVLTGLNLCGLDFSNRNLGDVIIRDSDLMDANFENSVLDYADLRFSDFASANFSNASLYNATLRATCCKNAYFYNADLEVCSLIEADLRNANLQHANLKYANLCNAALSNADLRNVRHKTETAFFVLQCPEEGSFIGYKKCCDYIVKLLIPEDAKRSSATSRKCRCSKAKVLSITDLDGVTAPFRCIKSDYDPNFIYTIGNTVEVSDFDENRWKECATGIHFFITRDEAVKY